MRAYYEMSGALSDFLRANESVNTVRVGNVDDIDLDKKSLYPLSQVIVGDVGFNNGTLEFTTTVICMDVIYDNESGPQTSEDYIIGAENKQDVYNTQLTVVNALQVNLKRGNLHESKFHLVGSPTATPFEDTYSGGVCGWSLEFTVSIPNNEVGVCDYTLPKACAVTFDSTNITFDLIEQ